MTTEAFGTWLDVMPIEDVRREIERLERELLDAFVLVRLYAMRQPPDPPEVASEMTGQKSSPVAAGAEASTEPISAEGSGGTLNELRDQSASIDEALNDLAATLGCRSDRGPVTWRICDGARARS